MKSLARIRRPTASGGDQRAAGRGGQELAAGHEGAVRDSSARLRRGRTRAAVDRGSRRRGRRRPCRSRRCCQRPASDRDAPRARRRGLWSLARPSSAQSPRAPAPSSSPLRGLRVRATPLHPRPGGRRAGPAAPARRRRSAARGRAGPYRRPRRCRSSSRRLRTRGRAGHARPRRRAREPRSVACGHFLSSSMHHAVGSTQLNVPGVQLQPRSVVSCRMIADLGITASPNAPESAPTIPRGRRCALPPDAH